MPVVDATSSLFLGFGHPSGALDPWDALTTGRPAALGEPPAGRALAAGVARWQGAQAGVLARSTLHALVDVLGLAVTPGTVLATDEFAYPITTWAAATVAQRDGVRLVRYPHHRVDLPNWAAGRRTVVVADGWCPGCNTPAPIKDLRETARRARGLLVLDDSQAFGVLGRRGGQSGPGAMFGDGSGTAAWTGAGHHGMVWTASLAKAFGAPLTVVTGDGELIGRLATRAGNRFHSSPPSAADVAAAVAALGTATPTDWYAAGQRAEQARTALARYVLRLRRVLAGSGPPPAGLPFPVITLTAARRQTAWRWHEELQRRGIRTLVTRPRCRGPAAVCLLLRADHSRADIDRMATALTRLDDQEVA